VSVRGGRRLTIHLLAGDPHALLLEEDIESFRPDALERLGLTAREREVLDAARTIGPEAEIADELFLSPRAVRARLARLEQKLGVRTITDAVAAALRASI
jgi:DNA-binding CsgD family transcriptional regulator